MSNISSNEVELLILESAYERQLAFIARLERRHQLAKDELDAAKQDGLRMVQMIDATRSAFYGRTV